MAAIQIHGMTPRGLFDLCRAIETELRSRSRAPLSLVAGDVVR